MTLPLLHDVTALMHSARAQAEQLRLLADNVPSALRQGAAQQTDVLQLDAQVVDVAREDGQQVVSVRFHGLIREAADAAAEPFDELWHFVRPLDGSREWAIAGITQNTAPSVLH